MKPFGKCKPDAQARDREKLVKLVWIGQFNEAYSFQDGLQMRSLLGSIVGKQPLSGS